MAYYNPTPPNLELLLYKAQQILAHDEEFVAALNEKKKERGHVSVDFDIEVFSQVWGSTCTGFDVCEDGSPAMGGSAMTKEYTTVIHERVTDCYCVFFGDRACYKVTNANDDFYEDLANRQMVSLSNAKTRY